MLLARSFRGLCLYWRMASCLSFCASACESRRDSPTWSLRGAHVGEPLRGSRIEADECGSADPPAREKAPMLLARSLRGRCLYWRMASCSKFCASACESRRDSPTCKQKQFVSSRCKYSSTSISKPRAWLAQTPALLSPLVMAPLHA